MITVYGPDALRPYMRPWPGSPYGVQRIAYNGGGAFVVAMAEPRHVALATVAAILREMQKTVSLGAAAPLELHCLDQHLLTNPDSMRYSEGIAQPGWIAVAGHAELQGLRDLITHEVTHRLDAVALTDAERAEFFALIGQTPGNDDDSDWSRRPQEILAEVLSHALWGEPIRPDMAERLNLTPDQVARVRQWALQQFGTYPPAPIVVNGEVTTIQLRINDPVMTISDGRVITLDSPPVLVNRRTLVPLRAIAEALGCEVIWDPVTWTVIIIDRWPQGGAAHAG